jgi:hypothetical protein
MDSATRAIVATACALCVGCSPAWDWREFQPEGSGIVARFPCKPDRHSRLLPVVGESVQMEMIVCSAGDATFVLVYADLADPAHIAPALAELRALATANIAAQTTRSQSVMVPGMTANREALRVALDGRRPDGAVVQEQAAFFARGLRIYQASVLGAPLPAEAADTFIESLRLPS